MHSNCTQEMFYQWWLVNAKHEARRLKLGETPHRFYSNLSRAGQKSYKPNVYVTRDDPLSVTRHCSLDKFPCFSINFAKPLNYSKVFCKALLPVATWTVRSRHKGDLRMTVHIHLPDAGHDLKPEAVMDVLELFFTSLELTGDGNYEVPPKEAKLMLQVLHDLHPLVAEQIRKQFIEDDHLDHPATPDPELEDQMPWYHRAVEMYISPSKAHTILKSTAIKKSPSHEIERLTRWVKLPMPFGGQLRYGNIWVASSQNLHRWKHAKCKCRSTNVNHIWICDDIPAANEDTRESLNNLFGHDISLSYWGLLEDTGCTVDFQMIGNIMSIIHQGHEVLLCCGGSDQNASVQAVKLLMVLYGSGWEQASKQWLAKQPAAIIQRSQVQLFQNQLYNLKVFGESEMMALDSQRRAALLSCFLSG